MQYSIVFKPSSSSSNNSVANDVDNMEGFGRERTTDEAVSSGRIIPVEPVTSNEDTSPFRFVEPWEILSMRKKFNSTTSRSTIQDLGLFGRGVRPFSIGDRSNASQLSSTVVDSSTNEVNSSSSLSETLPTGAKCSISIPTDDDHSAPNSSEIMTLDPPISVETTCASILTPDLVKEDRKSDGIDSDEIVQCEIRPQDDQLSPSPPADHEVCTNKPTHPIDAANTSHSDTIVAPDAVVTTTTTTTGDETETGNDLTLLDPSVSFHQDISANKENVQRRDNSPEDVATSEKIGDFTSQEPNRRKYTDYEIMLLHIYR